MKKDPTTAQRLEFEKLRAFVSVGFEDVCRSSAIAPEHLPAAVADRMWSTSPATALKGLRQAAADVVEMFQDFEGADLLTLEGRLAAAGAPSLAAMRSRRVAEIFRILNEAQIRGDEEWRLLNAVVSDTDDRILDDLHRAVAQRLLQEYEASKPADDSVRTELD
jgi:hypothetical protein